MTRQKAKELLPIITAFAEGKTIQIKNTISGKFETPTYPDRLFTDEANEYRIKPEPRKFWIVIYNNKTHLVFFYEPTFSNCNMNLVKEIIPVIETDEHPT